MSESLSTNEPKSGMGKNWYVIHTYAGFEGRARRVTSLDSFIPLGPAANHVLVREAQIEAAARALVRS